MIESHIVLDRFQQKAFCGAVPGVAPDLRKSGSRGSDGSRKENVLAKPGEDPTCPTCAKELRRLNRKVIPMVRP